MLTRHERIAALWKFPLVWAGVFALGGMTYALSLLTGWTAAIVAVWGSAALVGWMVERYFWAD